MKLYVFEITWDDRQGTIVWAAHNSATYDQVVLEVTDFFYMPTDIDTWVENLVCVYIGELKGQSPKVGHISSTFGEVE